MSDGFYRAFEDSFRGERELIKHRLEHYIPYIQPLRTLYPNASALDLGCGRGEWLEILHAQGFQAHGVDQDDQMLAECRQLNFNVSTQDALEAVQKLPSESEVIISGFHIAEHLPFDYLRLLVVESLRVLKPAGFLILETPNPENIVVGTNSFYLDPTHQRPLPPQLLQFLPQFSGFKRVTTLRLQQAPHLTDSTHTLSLLDVLGGVSPDYAVVAQKDAQEKYLELTGAVFENKVGYDLPFLTNRYDQSIQQIHTLAQKAHQLAHEAHQRSSQAQTDAQAALQAAEQCHEQLRAIHSSLSWKITKPLRSFQKFVVRTYNTVRKMTPQPLRNAIKTILRRCIIPGIHFVFKHPQLRARMSPLLKQWPWLHQRLLKIGITSGALAHLTGAFTHSTAQQYSPPPDTSLHISQEIEAIQQPFAGDTQGVDDQIDEILGRIRNELGERNERN